MDQVGVLFPNCVYWLDACNVYHADNFKAAIVIHLFHLFMCSI